MPIILRCDGCGKETGTSYPSNQGWIIDPRVGWNEVLCPDCGRKKTAAYASEKELEELLIKQ